jgi:hypothetical protein
VVSYGLELTPLALPINYTKDELEQLQNFWNEYLKNLRPKNAENLPLTIAKVITTLNDWLRLKTGLINKKKRNKDS